MRYLILPLLLLVGCQNAKSPLSGDPTDDLSTGSCIDQPIVKSITNAPFTVDLVAGTWCLETDSERLIPCADWVWDPQLQVPGTPVQVTGDYPEWYPLPNVRYIGRPFRVVQMEAR